MRKIKFENNQYYHIYARGVDKRDIFMDKYDQARFLQGIQEFNAIEPIGSIYENSFKKKQLGHQVSKSEDDNLVEIVAYCLNRNHYHLILKQVKDQGISKFIHKVNMGYSKFFNEKYDRSGALFQGPFCAVLIDTNEYLLYLSVYVNLNYIIHGLSHQVTKSSWLEYTTDYGESICDKDIILGQFKNKKAYKKYAEELIKIIKEKRDLDKYLLE